MNEFWRKMRLARLARLARLIEMLCKFIPQKETEITEVFKVLRTHALLPLLASVKLFLLSVHDSKRFISRF